MGEGGSETERERAWQRNEEKNIVEKCRRGARDGYGERGTLMKTGITEREEVHRREEAVKQRERE